MILCRKCRQLWPSGTRFCGSCLGSLGARYCPEDHQNPLPVRCCLTCGSKKLTQGVPSLNVRPLSWAIVLGFVLIGLPFLVSALATAFHGGVFWLLRTFLPPVVTLAVLSVFLGVVLGEKARTVIGKAWLLGFRLTAKTIELVFRILFKLVRR